MKVVILAGGLGTRISEESHLKPKPMVDIGGMPILWHVMKIYSQYGFNEFIICCGYKAYVIKEYFANYFLHNSDVTFDFTGHNIMEVHNQYAEPWKVTLVNTGLNTMTGGRIKRVKEYIGDETFMLTYGDGVADVNLSDLLEFHSAHGKIATITAVDIGQTKGVLEIEDNNLVTSFREKNDSDGAMINGGFMVMNPEIFNYIEGDETVFEVMSLMALARDSQLMSYMHKGFWQCMDTQREKQMLDELWANNTAPWKTW